MIGDHFHFSIYFKYSFQKVFYNKKEKTADLFYKPR